MLHSSATTRARQRNSPGSVRLSTLLDQWVVEGIITPEQADRILSGGDVPVRTPSAPTSKQSSLAVEALGYLGGVIIVTSAMLIAGRYWGDITTGVRLMILGGAATALLGSGFAVTDRFGDMGVRLRSVLWLGATAAVGGFLGLFGSEVFDLTGPDVGVLVGAGTAAVAGALWRLHRVFIQQFAMMAALMVTAATTIAAFVSTDSLPGLGVWMVGVIWLLLGWGGLLTPRRIILAFAASATIFGAMLTMPNNAGIMLSLITVGAAACLAVLFRDLILLTVGAFGALLVLPVAINNWFPGTPTVPFALLALGLVLVGAAIWTARRQRGRAQARDKDFSTGDPTIALLAAMVILAGVAFTVVTIAVT